MVAVARAVLSLVIASVPAAIDAPSGSTVASVAPAATASVAPAATASVAPAASTSAAAGTWAWPVVGPVTRRFDPPTTPFGAGHRGIDIAVATGTVVVAPETAVVAFAGKVGGELYVTLDHGGTLESTYSWLSSTLVRKNDVVARGQPIALSGQGHPGSTIPHLHLGVKLNDVYQDPLAYLGPMSVSSFIRLVA
jgi:murein DD-endopeptidase MepM/ murein hydrolase activator NlpD